ncbi:hypothetical protein H1Z61_06025 [Bacillus aquiflavi]|uniref:YfhD family protein n=1 Tax=Bacillus aquiflavi TaxID=2672567 RepID=A0A7W1X2Z7_9BACI|nr:hypothetical protein [Bacillus aquiflavi]MBA4536713.1 hypothetical protein [Bacillus aquiflavi]UAC48746.1 hypothetical protein K6959_01875 [Bacillus aquiflavi]
MGKKKSGNANAQRNNNAKQKNEFPKISTFAQMEEVRMEERKYDQDRIEE